MKYLLIFLIVFEISDGVLTHFLIKNGLAREGNPLLQPIVGDVGFIILKIVGALLCALILWDVSRRYRKLALIATSCCVVFYAGIVLWNLSVFAIML